MISDRVYKLCKFVGRTIVLQILAIPFTVPTAPINGASAGFLPTGEYVPDGTESLFGAVSNLWLLRKARDAIRSINTSNSSSSSISTEDPEKEVVTSDEDDESDILDEPPSDLGAMLMPNREAQVVAGPQYDVPEGIEYEVNTIPIYHKRLGNQEVEIASITVPSFAYDIEEYKACLRWLGSVDAIQYFNRGIRSRASSSSTNPIVPREYVPTDVEMTSIMVGDTVFTSIQDALDQKALDQILADEFISGGTKAEKLDQWYKAHPERDVSDITFPANPHTFFPPIKYSFTSVAEFKVMSQGGFNAKGGSGIPSQPRTNLITLDLFPTRVSCVLQALCFAWMFYTEDTNINGNNPNKKSVFDNMYTWEEVKTYYQKHILESIKRRKVPMQWSTDDADVITSYMKGYTVMQLLEGRSSHERILDSLEDNYNQFTNDTKVIYIYITKSNHASMLMHRRHLTPFWHGLVNARTNRLWSHEAKAPKLTYFNTHRYDYINAADTESLLVKDPNGRETNTPLVVCAKILGKSYEFIGQDCIENFVNMIANFDRNKVAKAHPKHKAKLDIWFHNLPYDLSLMLERLCETVDSKRDKPMEILSSNNKIISLTAYFHSGLSVRFRDSLKHYKISLKQWAKNFFPDDPSMWKSNHKILQCKTPEEVMSDESVSYCHKDVDVLIALLTKLQDDTLEEVGINQISTNTITGFSGLDFMTNYYDHTRYPIYVPTPNCEEYLRAAYTGGLNLIYKYGITKGKIINVDFNSKYPHVLTGDVPMGKPRHVDQNTLGKLKTHKDIVNYLTVRPGVYEVEVTVGKDAVPWLPLKTVNGLEVPHMTRVVGRWTSLRIIEAMDRGAKIHKIISGIWTELGPVMRDQMIAHHNKRIVTNNPIGKTIRKNIMNTGYGLQAFKHKGRRQAVVYGNRLSKQMMNNVNMGLAQGRLIGDLFVGDEVNDIHNEHVSVFIALWTTDRAQADLLKHVEAINAIPGYQALYTDTDSISVLCPSDINALEDIHPTIRSMLDNQELGKLKVECMQPYTKKYKKYCEEQGIQPVPNNLNFLKEIGIRNHKEYYTVDTNDQITIHVKAMNVDQLGYDYEHEIDTLRPYEKRLMAMTLMKSSMENNTSMTVVQRRMFTASLKNFDVVSTYNQVFELQLYGRIKKVVITDSGWTIPHEWGIREDEEIIMDTNP